MRLDCHLFHCRSNSRPITAAMISDAEKAIAEIIPVFRKLRRRCDEIEVNLLAAQKARDKTKDARNRERERKRLAREQERSDEEGRAASLLDSYKVARDARLDRLGDGSSVAKDACHWVAREAMDWKMKGQLMRAPGDADQLFPGPHGWEINRGGNSANRFGVELAIKWCRQKLAEYFPEHEPRLTPISEAELRELTRMVRCAIIGPTNKPYYDNYRPQEQERIALGNHYLVPRRTARAIVQRAGFPLA